MDLRQAGLGFVIFLVFWAFQAGYFSSLGSAEWFLSALLFGLLLFAIGKFSVPKQSEHQKMLRNFTFAFALAIGAVFSFVPSSVLGMVLPVNFTPAMFTPYFLSLLLALFGGYMFVLGWEEKWHVTMLTGVIWLFVATHEYTLGANAYLCFALITSLPFILYGILAKD